MGGNKPVPIAFHIVGFPAFSLKLLAFPSIFLYVLTSGHTILSFHTVMKVRLNNLGHPAFLFTS